MAATRPTGRPISTGRAVDRLINFSDAVVAVAITLMALPLVDIAAPTDGGSITSVLWEHAPQISTFLFTFYVVAIMWSAHNRILNVICGYDPAIFWANTTWLAAIVLLPWISAMFGESKRSEGGVGLLYWGMLAVISLLGTAMSRHIRLNPELIDEGEVRSMRTDARSQWRGVLFAGYFLLIGLISLVAPGISQWLPFGIIPLSIWLRPARQDADLNEHDPTSEPKES
jgi:uncharacterized membrane protein